METLKEKFNKLKKAVNNLYDAGYWQCDRDVNEEKLWEEIRDALGRKKGESPKRMRRFRCGMTPGDD